MSPLWLQFLEMCFHVFIFICSHFSVDAKNIDKTSESENFYFCQEKFLTFMDRSVLLQIKNQDSPALFLSDHIFTDFIHWREDPGGSSGHSSSAILLVWLVKLQQ